VDKIAQSTVGEGNAIVTACVGQGFRDQEAPSNGLLVSYPKALLEVEAGNGSAIFAAVIGLLTIAQGRNFLLNGCLCNCVGGVREWEFRS
jgi:hypothetical protein